MVNILGKIVWDLFAHVCLYEGGVTKNDPNGMLVDIIANSNTLCQQLPSKIVLMKSILYQIRAVPLPNV